MKYKYLIFDFSNTLAKMRPVKLLLPKSKLTKLSKTYKLAIITGAKRVETFNILKKLKINNLFSKTITKDDTNLKKPNPRLFDLVIDRKRIIVYIGDSSNDAKMAREAKICFLYTNDFKRIYE